MFDCVLPTRLGRTGSALTWSGRLNLENAGYRARPGAAATRAAAARRARASRAPTFATSSTSRNCSGHRLLSLHNLRFLLDLTAGARAAIERGEFAVYKREALARLECAHRRARHRLRCTGVEAVGGFAGAAV